MGFTFQGYGVQVDPLAFVVLAAAAAAVLAVVLWAPSDRSWWRRKRWQVAAALFLAGFPVAYPLADPLLGYAEGRGWISRQTGSRLGLLHRPLTLAFEATGFTQTPAYRWWDDVNSSWTQRGRDHRNGFWE